MINDSITVFHNGRATLIDKDVANQLNLRQGQDLNLTQFWEALGQNCSAGIAKCYIAKAMMEAKNDNHTD